MPDKLTDSEIVKALRSWLEEIRKSRQAYLEKVNEEHYPSMRYEYLLSDTIHEINRLRADVENYKQIAEHQQSVTMDRGFEIKRLKEKIDNLQAENERLKKGWKADVILTADAKAEAYKEFAERLKADIGVLITHLRNGHVKHILELIDNLLKELVGDT